jgi:O-antigen/teichoic acid export membrane protein
LIGAAAVPYLIRQIGVEAFGILTLVWALIGYFSLFDFGLGRALTQQISTCLAEGKSDSLQLLAKSGVLLTATTGLAGGLILLVLAYPLAHHWLSISPSLHTSVTWSLCIAALGIPMTTVTSGLRGVLEAYEDFRLANLLRIFLGTVNFGLPVICVMLLGPSLTWMIVSLIAARLLVFVAHFLLVDQKLPRGWRTSAITVAQVRPLFSFGAWMTVTNVVGPLMVTADRFVIASVLGAQVVAFYTVPAELSTRMLLVPAALTAALFPRLAALLTHDIVQARRLYQKCLKIVLAFMAPVSLLIALGAHRGLSLWLGQDFADHAGIILAILSLGIMLNSIALVPFNAIQAAGQAHLTAKIHLVELMLYAPMLVYGLRHHGLVAAAILWVVRVGVDLVALLYCAQRYAFAPSTKNRFT